MTAVEVFAPAKVNLTLHVTGRRPDGYHELDSLVVFAEIGDRLEVTLSEHPALHVTGPMAKGVPEDDGNIVMRAMSLIGVNARIELHKYLPNAAGLGGGSSDAAAALRALSDLSGRALPGNLLALGADVPVCVVSRAARMRGVGEQVETLQDIPPLHAVLVNPNVAVPTGDVFSQLDSMSNAPMPRALPHLAHAGGFVAWLRGMRNDLQAPAIAAQPVIAQVLEALHVTSGCQLARMTGSGATCFGLYSDAETAASAAGRLREAFPGWWVAATRLNAVS